VKRDLPDAAAESEADHVVAVVVDAAVQARDGGCSEGRETVQGEEMTVGSATGTSFSAPSEASGPTVLYLVEVRRRPTEQHLRRSELRPQA
jgi:hypothetical protein